MEQTTLSLLRHSQSPDPNVRMTAELDIRKVSSQSEFPISLVNIADSSSLDIPIRQTALIILKTYVMRYWSPTFEEYVGPSLSKEAKSHVRAVLSSLISDPDRKIRVAAAYVVSRIANADFPEDWPGLMTGLMEMLHKGGKDQVHGAMRVLKEFIEDALTEEQFFSVAKDLVDVLLRIAMTDEHTIANRAMAVAIFESCLDSLEMVKDLYAEPIRVFMDAALPPWFEFYTACIQINSHDDITVLKIEIVKTLNKLKVLFPHHLNRVLSPLFSSIWSDLQCHSRNYHSVIYGDIPEYETPDGESESLSTLITEQLDFLKIGITSRSIKEEILRAGMLEKLIEVLFSLSRITEDMENDWEDVNKFVDDEIGETPGYGVRHAVADLLQELYGRFEGKILEIVWNQVVATFQNEINDENWRLCEGALFCLGILSDEIGEIKDLELHQKLTIILDTCLEVKDHTFLRGRVLCISGQLSNIVHESSGKYFLQCIKSLQLEVPGVVKVSALRALLKFCKRLPRETLIPYQQAILNSVTNFVAQATDETTVLLVETLSMAIKIDYSAATRNDNPFMPMLFNIAASNPGDPYVRGLITDCFEDLVVNSDDFVRVAEVTFPSLLGALQNDSDERIVSLAIELLNCLVKGGPSPMPEPFFTTMFPVLAIVMERADDMELLQTGQEYLKYVIRKDSINFLRWSANGRSALDITMHIIARLLHPSIEESASIFVGPLLIEMFDRLGEAIGPFVPEILTFAVKRLETAKAPNFIQTLVAVFAHLALKQAETMVRFLEDIKIEQRNGLEGLMKAWLENFEVLQGHSHIKLSSIALANIFNLQSSSVAAIKVKGDLITLASGRIVTRSQALTNPDQWSRISVPSKIIKLLIHELGSSEATLKEGAIPDDEDDDWENFSIDTLQEYAALEGVEGGDEDEGLLKDVNLQVFLKEFFRHAANDNVGGFWDIYKNDLSVDERGILSVSID
ncbi:Importin subunit beta-5 [Neolecta irregularis DAH-3]|uniref:Importin subunit beta-5 n=1 Tax=Neolecta irregularis (strain DAH-3) TaxID=1198029 RepID=A0A1U7LHD6_NEOID|nr:Importin subunit beta-5 [Neolecta irregularis DAH-3]|eukprot:OLL22059.1 Importin subunit beta-5 [Neolecta irregularis DAH-3]